MPTQMTQKDFKTFLHETRGYLIKLNLANRGEFQGQKCCAKLAAIHHYKSFILDRAKGPLINFAFSSVMMVRFDI
ncbi:MAG: hypothetical protein AB2693_31330 [Candidatus Thiodiazotropha sp.]